MSSSSTYGGVRRLVALTLALSAALLVSGCSSGDDPGRHKAHRAAPIHVNLKKLVASNTDARINRAPRDSDPQRTTQGDVVHPERTLPLFTRPAGRPFAKVAPKQMGATWLPVVERRNGWLKVLLPSRPNGSVGWIQADQVKQARTPYLIRVHVGSRELELFKDDSPVGSWPVAVGAPGTPTPTGRTFLLGSIVDDNASFSPVILPLGTHSKTLDTYGGGPGTVALHGWPDTTVFGNAVSHGCIRVPADALQQLTQVPLGTLVLVDDE